MRIETPHHSAFHIDGQAFQAPRLDPGLYVVSTPIGNLGDITLRALKTLAAADAILCEDTRQSIKLLNHFGIKTKLHAFHEHNEHARVGTVLDRIKDGEVIALISDAGTPLVSDPGFPLVRAARDAELPVFALPGASAILGALATAGLPTDSFSFFGFLPPKSGARSKVLAALAERPETLVFYESPRRLASALSDMADVFGPDRTGVVALELTKRFERVARGNLGALVEMFSDGETKGEAVIIVAGASAVAVDEGDWQAALASALADEPLRAAVDDISQTYGIKRKQVYDAALALKKKS